MNSIARKAIFFLMSLTVLLAMAACGGADVTPGPDIAATETADAMLVHDTPTPEPRATPKTMPTLTPTTEPTAIPTLSPTVPPSPIGTPTEEAQDETVLQDVTLTVEDLPAGFVEVPSTILGLDSLAAPETGGVQVPENIFAFLDQSQFRVVAGFVEELEDEMEIIAFDETITPTLEMFLQGVGSGLGMQDQVDFQFTELTGLEEIGDKAVGATTSIESEQATLRIEVVVFRREQVEAVLMILYPQGLSEGLTPPELAKALDKRIMDALEATG